ncbi:MAG: ABC transporter ATP-binding protein [Phycisphaerae bacterium]
MMPILDLKNIDFLRGSRMILSGVSWTIQPGQHWALLGANGSGKTTLLKIITGYEWPSEGSVSVLGQNFGQCNLPQLRKTIGWVSCALEHNLPEFDTALQIVASGFEASLGLYRDFTQNEFLYARQALEFLGGGYFVDQPYSQLSQGEQQRVLIARALVNKPALLILDEPCSGLDPAARESFLNDLARLTRQNNAPTLIYVTHHIEEIGPWITHVLVLKTGQTLAAGPAPEVLTSRLLSVAFDHPCIVENHNTRYYLRMH